MAGDAIFTENLNRYMRMYDKTRKQVAQELNIPYTTFTDWCNGNRCPKMGKIEELCAYFHCQKSDLLQKYDPSDPTDEMILEAYRKADDHTKEIIRRLLAYNEVMPK